jgi:signal transduction histidine kinase
MRGASLFGSLRGRLVLLALALLLPAIAASGLLLSSAYHASRAALERQIGDQARALGLVVDRQLGQDRVLIHALGVAPSFRAGNWPAFEAAARAAAPGPDTWIAVLDSEGSQFLNTRVQPGAPLPRAPPYNPADWEVLPDGTRLSGLVQGIVVRAPVVVTDLEIRLDDGRLVHLRVTRKAASFDRLWREQKFPSSWAGVVLDSRYRVVTRSRGGPQYVGREASPTMQNLMRGAAEGVAQTRTLEGVDSISGWSRSERGGWSFIVAAPKAEVVGAATQPLILAALIAVGLMAAGVALAWWMGRRLALPMEALTSAARRLERGDTPDLAPCGVAEIDDLGDAVSQAAGRIAGHQSELQAINASLEARVAERTRELEEATENLVQAQKLEAIGRLTGGVAHDFNNLLMAISGNLELMGRRVSDPNLLRYVDRARQATDRGAKLTSQLLAFSRRQRLQPRPIDVNELTVQARDLLGSTLGGAVVVETELAEALWPAMADATQLELVIMNLAINARDAMVGGGVVTIRTANVHRDQPGPREESPPAGDFVMVAVADTGSGMPPDVERRVFEPFFTTKDIGQGSGLGLPQVLGLAKQLRRGGDRYRPRARHHRRRFPASSDGGARPSWSGGRERRSRPGGFDRPADRRRSRRANGRPGHAGRSRLQGRGGRGRGGSLGASRGRHGGAGGVDRLRHAQPQWRGGGGPAEAHPSAHASGDDERLRRPGAAVRTVER